MLENSWLSFVSGLLNKLTNPKEESMHPEGLCFAVGNNTSQNKLGSWGTITVSSRDTTYSDYNRNGDYGKMHMYRLSDNSLVICNNVKFGYLKDGVMPPDMLGGHEIDIEKFMTNLICYPNEEHIVHKYIGNIIPYKSPIEKLIESLIWQTDIQLALDDHRKIKDIKHPFVISRDHVDEKEAIIHQYTVLPNASTIDFCKTNLHAYEVLATGQPLRFYLNLELKKDKNTTLFDSTKTDDMIKEAIDHVYAAIEFYWPELINELILDRDRPPNKQLVKQDEKWVRILVQDDTMKPIVLKMPNETTVKSARVIFPQLKLRGPKNMAMFQTIIKKYIKTENKLMQEIFKDGDINNLKVECILPFQTEHNKTLQDGDGLEYNNETIKNAYIGIYGKQYVIGTPFGDLEGIMRDLY